MNPTVWGKEIRNHWCKRKDMTHTRITDGRTTGKHNASGTYWWLSHRITRPKVKLFIQWRSQKLCVGADPRGSRRLRPVGWSRGVWGGVSPSSRLGVWWASLAPPVGSVAKPRPHMHFLHILGHKTLLVERKCDCNVVWITDTTIILSLPSPGVNVRDCHPGYATVFIRIEIEVCRATLSESAIAATSLFMQWQHCDETKYFKVCANPCGLPYAPAARNWSTASVMHASSHQRLLSSRARFSGSVTMETRRL